MKAETYEWVVMLTETKAVYISAAFILTEMDQRELRFYASKGDLVPCAVFRQWVNWWRSYPTKIQEI